MARIAAPPPKAAFTTERVFIYYPLLRGVILLAAVPFGIIARFRRGRLQMSRATGRDRQAALRLMFLHGNDEFSARITHGHTAALSSQAEGTCR